MRRERLMGGTAVGLCIALAAMVTRGATVDEQPAGPVADGAQYAVSPHGGHVAVVAPKGSRVVVVVDGVAGPKLDAVITPVVAYVDPRPAQAASQAGHSASSKAEPVTFSDDGKHYAYLGRSGEEWVLIEDGNERLRIPAGGAVGGTVGVGGMAGNTDVRLQFAGGDAKHLLLAKTSLSGGYELWVDGQKWPGAYGSGGSQADATDPIISPDGSRIACVAQVARDKATVLIDGQDAGYLADHLQWTPDGKHLVGIGHSPKGDMALLVDGKPLIRGRAMFGVYLAPVGNRIILALQHHDAKTGANGTFLLVDGKPAEATLCDMLKKVIFSPDGKHYAALCGKSGADWVVLDGKKGQVYQTINDGPAIPNSQIGFSPDSSKLVYAAMANGKWFAVTNDDESDAFTGTPAFVFSADGKHMAMSGMPSQESALLVIDGKATRRPRSGALAMATFTFSPDGARYASIAGSQVMLDGADTGINGVFAFSPDSKHLAIAGTRAADNARGMFLDGKLVARLDQLAFHLAFTPDSKHLYWVTREPAARKDAPPGTYEFVTYLDGKPVARTDDRTAVKLLLLPNGYAAAANTVPAWDVGPDGALTTVTMTDDAASRVKVTPTADTSLSTLLATAEAGGKSAQRK